MNVSDKLIKMLQHHEGVRYKPYRCPAQLWTIGVGHVMYPEQAKLPLARRGEVTLRIEDFREFSKEEVDGILKSDLARFERGVHTYCGNNLVTIFLHGHFKLTPLSMIVVPELSLCHF